MRTVVAEHFQQVKFFDLPPIDGHKANAELRAKKERSQDLDGSCAREASKLGPERTGEQTNAWLKPLEQKFDLSQNGLSQNGYGLTIIHIDGPSE